MLMYHACGSPGEPASTYVIPLRRFAWQMRWLARRGYNVISLSEYLRCRAEHRLPPAKSVVLTFDDGYVDNLTNATPVLRQHGFPATLFVVTGHVGGSNCWDAAGDLVGRPLVSWAQVRRMVDATWDIGAHTETHCWLSEADSTRLEAELAQPRAALEPVLGHPVTTFAYPGGRHDARSASALARAGYVAACSSHHGANDFGTDPFLLRRAEVRGDASRLRFACAVAFGSARPWARYQYRSVFSWSVDRSPPHSVVE
jgi:peptidoglycan/xylan/chitin deacetylase (PgdA/CDA1 family)